MTVSLCHCFTTKGSSNSVRVQFIVEAKSNQCYIGGWTGLAQLFYWCNKTESIGHLII